MEHWAIIQANAISFLTNLVLGVAALFVSALAIRLVDHLLFRKLHLEEEITKGNMAAAVYGGAIWIALALILTHAG